MVLDLFQATLLEADHLRGSPLWRLKSEEIVSEGRLTRLMRRIYLRI